MRKFAVRLSVGFLLAVFAHTSGFALQGTGPIASEQAFLAAMGDRAVFVAPGVYEVQLESKDKIRFAFGDAGRQFDRTRFEGELARVEARIARTPRPTREELRHADRLRNLIAKLGDPLTAHAADTGWTCPGNTIQYAYSLDGYLSGGNATALANIGLGIDFGPPPPSYPDRYAYALAIAWRGATCREFSADDSDAVTHGGLGFADAAASIGCGANCVAWATFADVTQAGCSDGYRSLSRSGGSLESCDFE